MRALITGITGQDGRYLSALLNKQGYEVFGLVRNTNVTVRNAEIIYGDITALPKLPDVDEVYNLAAMSHVGESFKNPGWTMKVNAEGAVNMLHYAKSIGAKFYQASTSELFGNAPSPQTISTPMNPVSPYGVAKLAAHRQVEIARDEGMYACSGILFNHESPYRGDHFVTQKICLAAARIRLGLQDRLTLGDLSPERDWGHAKDYARGMWQIMQQEHPRDYILATGVTHSVREFVEQAFSEVDLWWADYVEYSDAYARPNDVRALRGVSNAAFWEPQKTFESLVQEMVDAALRRFS